VPAWWAIFLPACQTFWADGWLPYEEELVRAREIAIEKMKAHADRLGADAVVGVEPDYEVA